MALSLTRERNGTMGKRVDAYIARDPSGVCRVFVKRGKFKHWFELGKHRETDTAFERALSVGAVHFGREIVDKSQLFRKK